MFRQWRRKRALKKVEPGDGSALKGYRTWQLLWRSLFFIELAENGRSHEYAVEVDFLGDWDADLYRDGRHAARAEMPAVLPVPGGVIEVNASLYGLKRMHLVADDGTERVLQPHRSSLEGLRMRFDRRFPRASRAIARTAIAVLLTGLVVLFLPTVATISRLEPIADHLGTYTAPYSLPGWLYLTLTIAGVVAAIERALTLRNHWLIDLDSWWMG